MLRFAAALVFTSLAFGQSPAGGYIGSDACKRCHPDVSSTFFRNPHYKSIASGNEPPEHTGCEGCHGPGAKHVSAMGGKATIAAFSVLSPRETVTRCLECHGRDISKSNLRRSTHTLANVACTSCHSIHKSATDRFLLGKLERDVCYGCHGNVRGEFSMPFKHRVNEGFMTCSDCHNPHGAYAPSWRMGQRPRMVEQALGNEEACIRCHVDKRGPFVFEHAAVRVDGCEVCHRPHGSANPRLMRRPVVFTLCLECHTGFGNFGRRGTGDPRQTPFHNTADPKFQNCTACHVRIHGSNADPRFFR